MVRPPSTVTTFVFVTGANGTSTAANELVARGHRWLAVDLAGHGSTSGQFRLSYQAPQDLLAFATEPSPMAGVTLDDYVAATVAVVRRVAEHGPVVLVGGSMGGAAVSQAANAVPDLIDHLVYDSAYCCVDLASPAEYLQTPEGRASRAMDLLGAVVGDPAVLGVIRSNWRTADRGFLARARDALMADATEPEFLAVLNTLQPDEGLTISVADARGEADTWGRIPRTYIRHTEDRIIPLALQDRMIAEADALTPDNPFAVESVRASHVPTVARFEEIVDILDRLARRRTDGSGVWAQGVS
ncbi:alpha/beta fold hydrolase [Actinopolymorpha pittospori]|uniref:Pimeloyl-ACP methyl ester carboxylesterase n=1 Tax=Actinopolymorpha pittospori TaxID=648752 RepID=A0A927REP0_9ACTN|nr:alpha/beta hydrolase [Actinopolymorpha pittospori]MBE1609375.1 pimeloyl-ACP methyl ester carboxylesterase [Actinopolymorpha pittospori]